MAAPSPPEPALLHWAWDLPGGGPWPRDMGDPPGTRHTCHCRRPRPQQAGHICRQRSPPVGRGTGLLSGWVGGPAPLPDQQAARPTLVVHHCLLTGWGWDSAHIPQPTPHKSSSLLITTSHSFTLHRSVHTFIHSFTHHYSKLHSIIHYSLIFPSHPSFIPPHSIVHSFTFIIHSFIHTSSFTP